jgi:hypothetical protein
VTTTSLPSAACARASLTTGRNCPWNVVRRVGDRDIPSTTVSGGLHRGGNVAVTVNVRLALPFCTGKSSSAEKLSLLAACCGGSGRVEAYSQDFHHDVHLVLGCRGLPACRTRRGGCRCRVAVIASTRCRLLGRAAGTSGATVAGARTTATRVVTAGPRKGMLCPVRQPPRRPARQWPASAQGTRPRGRGCPGRVQQGGQRRHRPPIPVTWARGCTAADRRVASRPANPWHRIGAEPARQAQCGSRIRTPTRWSS